MGLLESALVGSWLETKQIVSAVEGTSSWPVVAVHEGEQRWTCTFGCISKSTARTGCGTGQNRRQCALAAAELDTLKSFASCGSRS
jgi:hypothetical protein